VAPAGPWADPAMLVEEPGGVQGACPGLAFNLNFTSLPITASVGLRPTRAYCALTTSTGSKIKSPGHVTVHRADSERAQRASYGHVRCKYCYASESPSEAELFKGRGSPSHLVLTMLFQLECRALYQ
jgi:hypothetical protein